MPDEQTLGELSRSMARMEGRSREIDQSQDDLANKLRDDGQKIRDLQRELVEVRRVAAEAKIKAEGVAATLLTKQQDEEAQARNMTKIGRLAQLALTVVIVVLLGWSGQFTAALGKFQSLFGAGK